MSGRSNLLPMAMAAMIFMLALIAITTGRSNDPGVTGDDTYPHHICTFIEYCEGTECTREPSSFVFYLEHLDGEPRLEIPRTQGTVTIGETGRGPTYRTTRGEISGTFSLYSDRNFDWAGLSGPTDIPIEHYGTGRCERLRTP